VRNAFYCTEACRDEELETCKITKFGFKISRIDKNNKWKEEWRGFNNAVRKDKTTPVKGFTLTCPSNKFDL